MPLYEYECRECGHRVEVIQRFSDAPLTTCEKCGGAVKKLLSAPAVQFKGTGWYVTDYGGKSTAGGSKESGAATQSEGKEAKEGKSASKAADKKESTKGSDAGSGSSGGSSGKKSGDD